MNRKQRLASLAEGKRLQKLPFNEFKDVTDFANKRHRQLNPLSDYCPDKVWQNNHYIVQIFYNNKRKGKLYTKAMICRSDSQPLINWQDIYRIKNEIFGEEQEAIQFLPPKSELIDVANLYWIYIETNPNNKESEE